MFKDNSKKKKEYNDKYYLDHAEKWKEYQRMEKRKRNLNYCPKCGYKL